MLHTRRIPSQNWSIDFEVMECQANRVLARINWTMGIPTGKERNLAEPTTASWLSPSLNPSQTTQSSFPMQRQRTVWPTARLTTFCLLLRTKPLRRTSSTTPRFSKISYCALSSIGSESNSNPWLQILKLTRPQRLLKRRNIFANSSPLLPDSYLSTVLKTMLRGTPPNLPHPPLTNQMRESQSARSMNGSRTLSLTMKEML